MSRKVNMIEHPAYKTLRKLRPSIGIPKSITLIKQKKEKKTYRLEWENDNEKSIIAKNAKSERLKNERLIYLSILPLCDFTSAKFIGLVEDTAVDFSWIFLEDAKIFPFDPENENHRIKALKWLARLHTSYLTEKNKNHLQIKGAEYFKKVIEGTFPLISKERGNPNFTSGQVSILKDIKRQLKIVKSNWPILEDTCLKVPYSLIHADFHKGNLGIRGGGEDAVPIVFDWEMAAWGTPLFDLGSPFVYNCSHNELTIYSQYLNSYNKRISINDIQQNVNIGRVLKLGIYIYWESHYLDLDWVYKSMKRMKYYRNYYSEVLNRLSWT